MTTKALHDIAYLLATEVAARKAGRTTGLLEISWPPDCVLINGQRCTTVAQARKAVRS